MFKPIYLVLACLIFGDLAAPVYPQCGPGGCSPAQVRRAAQAVPELRWVRRADTPSEVYLFRGDQQIGGYSYATGFYRELRGEKWSAPVVAPLPPPFGEQQQGAKGLNFGLSQESFGTEEKIWEGDKVYSSFEAGKVIGADLPDDTAAGHVTGVAKSLGLKNKMAEDIAVASLQPGAAKAAKTQAYDYSHQVNQEILAPFRLDADRQFQEKGQVVIAQAAALDKEGRSKATAFYDYSGVPTWIDALRTVDPTFDPNKPLAPLLPGLPAINWELVALLLVGGVVLVVASRG